MIMSIEVGFSGKICRQSESFREKLFFTYANFVRSLPIPSFDLIEHMHIPPNSVEIIMAQSKERAYKVQGLQTQQRYI